MVGGLLILLRFSRKDTVITEVITDQYEEPITNLLETLDFISDTLSNGHNVDEVMFHQSFRTRITPRLIQKLKGYGIRTLKQNGLKIF